VHIYTSHTHMDLYKVPKANLANIFGNQTDYPVEKDKILWFDSRSLGVLVCIAATWFRKDTYINKN